MAIRTLARALAPGEPVRIVVRAAEPLVDVQGELDGEPLTFTAADSPAALTGTGSPSTSREKMTAREPAAESSRERGAAAKLTDAYAREGENAGEPANGAAREWYAWAAIALDRKPGPARLEVRARSHQGGELTGALSVRIAAKRFPEQRLSVEEKFVTPPAEVQERIDREQKRLAAVYASRRAAAAPRRPFARPVPGGATGVFGTRRIFNGKPRAPHPGLDLKAGTGTPVRASGPGVVALAEDLWFSGNTVIVDHGGGLFTIYAHLSRIDAQEGRTVRAGDRLGLSGATGRVTGPHLHWGAKVGDRAFDPSALLDAKLFD